MKTKHILALPLLLGVFLSAFPSIAKISNDSIGHIALFASARECPLTTASGTIIPKAGKFKGDTINYEDTRGKHTCFATKTQAQLEALVKNPDKQIEKDFSQAFKSKDKAISSQFGAQLNQEAGDKKGNYANLLQEAIEKGTYDPVTEKIYYTAEFIVGADTESGVYTKRIRVDGMKLAKPGDKGQSNGVHMFPYAK